MFTGVFLKYFFVLGKDLTNFVPFAVEQFKDDSKVSFSFFREHKFSIFWFHSNRCCHSGVGIKATERDLDLPDACYDVRLFQWNLQNFVAVYNGGFGMPPFGVASSQLCFEIKVRGSFSCSAFWVQESKMLTVHSFEDGLGDSDGHVVWKAFNDDSFC